MDLTENITRNSENRLQTCPLHNASDQMDEDFSGEAKGSLECFSHERFQSGFNSYRYHPLLFHLQKLKWSVFGTLTWKNGSRRLGSYESEKARQIDFRQLLKKTCILIKLRQEDVFYYHSTEYGKSGECHFHFLLLNIKPHKVSNSLLADTMQNLWRNYFVPFDAYNKSGGAGIAVICPYDENKENSAVDYCLKREFDEHGQERERYDAMSDNLFKLLVKNNNKLFIDLGHSTEKPKIEKDFVL